MKLILLALTLMVSVETHAQALDVPAATSIRKNDAATFLSEPNRPTPENLRLNGRPLNPAELRSLLEKKLNTGRAAGGGGDDVGNGGDELRQEFLALAQEILNEVDDGMKARLAATLEIRRIVVTNNLQVQSGAEAIAMRAVVSEGVIFLDSSAWDPARGLLSRAQDPRLEMLRLMNSSAGQPYGADQIAQAWNKLSPRSGKIWCPFYQTRVGQTRTKKEFNMTGLNAKGLEAFLVGRCEAAKLVECRMSKVITRGGGQYEMTVTGFEINVAAKSRAQLQTEKCEAARSCEIAYDWAPRGQVSPADYAGLGKEIGAFCR